MNANTQIIPESDDIASISADTAAQIFSARIDTLVMAGAGTKQAGHYMAMALWPGLSNKAAQSANEAAIRAKMAGGLTRDQAT